MLEAGLAGTKAQRSDCPPYPGEGWGGRQGGGVVGRARATPEQGDRLPQALGGGGLWEPLCPLASFQPLEPKMEGLAANPGPDTGPAEPVWVVWAEAGGGTGGEATLDKEVAVPWAHSAPFQMGAGPAHPTAASWDRHLCHG